MFKTIRTPFFKTFLLGILLIFCLSGPALARTADSLKSTFRPVLSLGFAASYFGAPLWVNAGVSNTRHTWLAGVSYRPHLNSNRFIFGAQYQYFPNPPARRFDLFFQFETMLGKEESNFLTAFYTGYGLSVRIGRRGWFRTHYGLGLIQGVENPFFLETESLDLTGNLRFGFGFRF